MRTLLYDIETSPRLAYVWGHWETDVLDVQREWYMLCFAYKWLGDKSVSAYSLPDFKTTYKKDDTNDRDLCLKLWELFDQADVIVAHNGSSFDTKKANVRFLCHGFKPPSPVQEIDTKRVAKSRFRFESNSLDNLGEQLKLGRKAHHHGIHTWLDVLRGDRKAWREMITYNKQDVVLLEKVYLALRPWMTNHPNTNVVEDTSTHCPICGSANMQKAGVRMLRTGRQQRYQCQDCGGWGARPLSGQGVIR